MGAALAAWLSAAAVAQDPAKPSADVEARLSAAALAEAKGEYEIALRELQEASRLADEASRPRIQEAVTALVQRHRQGSSPLRTPGQDPVLDLIATLDRGTAENQQVHLAMRQLQQLGALVVPTVLKKLPELGPFGLLNALELLAPIDDPRIAPALMQQLAKGEPGVADAIGRALESMTPATARTLATALTEASRPIPAQLAALELLLRQDVDPESRRHLVERLLGRRAAHEGLFGLIDRGFALGDGVLERLAEQAEGETTHRAHRHLLLHSDLTEAQALAGLQQLPAEWRGITASDLAEQHDDWARVGVAAISAQPPVGFDRPWFKSMHWWLASDDAAMALLALLPKLEPARRGRGSSTTSRDIETALNGMVAHGWRMSAQIEPLMVEMAVDANWNTFASALPDDGEQRALAVLTQLDARNRVALFTAVLHQERRWNRLFVECLDSMEGPMQLSTNMLERDWRGIDEATTQRFAAVVARWQTEWPPLGPRQRNATTISGQNAIDWRLHLCNACRYYELPVDVIVPLTTAQDTMAFSVLAQQAPERALAEARNWSDLRGISDQLLPLFETGRTHDMELAARIVRESPNSAYRSGEFLKAIGRDSAGSLPILALGDPTALEDPTGWRVKLALGAASGARVADLDALLRLLPDLAANVAEKLLEALDPQLQPDQFAKLIQTLEELLAPSVDPAAGTTAHRLILARLLLATLRKLDATAALPAAQRLLDLRFEDYRTTTEAVTAILALTSTDREAMLGTLLADDRMLVVDLALRAEDLGQHPALRPQIEQAILRHCRGLSSLDLSFDHLGPDERLRTALALASRDELKDFSRGVCESIVQVLSAEKSGSLAPAIARVARHPASDVRVRATDALGNTFAKEAVPFLIDLLRDDDEEVRKHANDRLAEISNYFAAKEKWSELLK